MITSLRRQIAGLLVACGIAGVALACGSDDSPTTASSAPQITSCSSVNYKGQTYSWGSSTGCNNTGVSSFQTTITQGGSTVCFVVSCTAGCLSSVRVC